MAKLYTILHLEYGSTQIEIFFYYHLKAKTLYHFKPKKL